MTTEPKATMKNIRVKTDASSDDIVKTAAGGKKQKSIIRETYLQMRDVDV